MSAASSPCHPRQALFHFNDGDNNNNKMPSSPSMPIQIATTPLGNNSHWLYHSFSAPCRTHQIGGGATDYGTNNAFCIYDANTNEGMDHHLLHHYHLYHHFDVPSLSSVGCCGCGTVVPASPRANSFVRSQSESAALNKLVQLNNAQHKPRHFLDEFEIWRNRKSQNGGAQLGTASAGPAPVGSGREVKFFDEPHPLQSDSEGEDSLVSPDEEVSPSGSCAEEEEEEEEEEEDIGQQQQQQHDGTSAGPPMLDVLDELVGQLEGIDIGQQGQETARKMGFSDHLHQQQHHQLMPPMAHYMDSLFDTIASPLASDSSSSSSCLFASSGADALAPPMAPPSPYLLPPHPPTSLVEPPTSDYATVPSMLASVDLAMPAEPSPLVQLPFQNPLINVELCHRRPSLDAYVVPSLLLQPSSVLVNNNNAGSGNDAPGAEPSPPTPIPALVEAGTGSLDTIKNCASAIMPPTTATIGVSCGGDSVVAILPPEALPSALRPLKRVRFADDCGQCLETVRVMTEPSDYPPKISPAVLRRIRRAAAAAAAVSAFAANAGAGTTADGQPLGNNNKAMSLDEDSDELDELEAEEERQRKGGGGGPIHRRTWKMAFKQPASEYVHFRDTLDRQRVALENVMLKNELCRMVGTIKVANIAFEKHVFVRHTANGWKTFSDVEAQWQCSPSKTFDTFRFDVPLPRNNECPFIRVEFCVRFLAGSSPCVEEHWDSNDGKNFVLLTNDHHPTMTTTTTTMAAQTLPMSSSAPALLIARPSSFSAFSSPSAQRPWTPTTAATKSGTAKSAPANSSPSLSCFSSLDINHNDDTKTAAGRSLPKQIERSSSAGTGIGTGICDRDDPYRVDWNSPSGLSSTTFGAWKQLTTDGPYW